jgi:site-specific DNA recombinase
MLVCAQCDYAYYGKPVSRRAAKGATRHYAYYRCTGTDAYRFGGERICANKQVRTDLLEAAVWDDVCALLKEPGRLETEYRRRLDHKTSDQEIKERAQSESLIQKVKRGIARLIDAYGEGLVDKEEFEPRIRQFKERLARLEEQAKAHAELAAQEQQLRLVIGQLQDFAERVKEDLDKADWSTRRDVIRALVKRIEIDGKEVRVVYRVDLSPFADGPEGGRLPDCRRGDDPALRCPLPRSMDLGLTILGRLDHGRFQPQAEQLQHRTVRNPHPQARHQLVVRNRVERLHNMMPLSRTHRRPILKRSR